MNIQHWFPLGCTSWISAGSHLRILNCCVAGLEKCCCDQLGVTPGHTQWGMASPNQVILVDPIGLIVLITTVPNTRIYTLLFCFSGFCSIFQFSVSILYPLTLLHCCTKILIWNDLIFKNLFFFLNYSLAMVGLRCCTRAFSMQQAGARSSVWYVDFLLQRLLLLQSASSRCTGFSGCRVRVQ